MSTTGKEYKLAIRIAGVIDKSFTTSLTAANSKLLALDKNFTKLDKGFDSIVKAGTKCFSAIATAAGVATVAITAATAASIAVGKEFETAFTSVKKTVDATEEEYDRLKQDILEMSRVLPSSAADIAEVMAIAGQLGIDNDGLDNLTKFTETMINLGVSTNLSAEEAATALAKFANITSMDAANYERLGSVIVDLGNNFATTEADIVTMATRLASTGELVGLSESQIMALATAMSSVGIASESGGSTMSKLLKKMQIAVETNSKSLENYASVAGMTGEQFKQTFQEDAVVALSAFIDGLNDTERNGMSAIAILDDMGLNEVRLSNTVLALANAEGVMSDAIATANTAWEENTALAEEAGKRYGTTDSQIQIMANSFKELGIVAYEELKEPFLGVISSITGGVQNLTEYVGGPNGIGKWIDNIGTKLPTLQRKFKKYGEPVFDAIVNTGKWIVKHGNGIISMIVGIGTALAAYKIASTLSHIVTTLVSLSPASWAVIGVTTAISGLVSAYTAYKLHEQEMIDNNLAEHFGNIALSMEDIKAIAEYIVSSDSLGGVKRALEAFEDLEVFSATMEDSIKEINKMNWKVSIGMELTPDEQESYKAAIQEYVSAAQEYALQSQYAVSLNLSVWLDENTNVVDKVNQFYADKYDELSALGTQLNEAVTDAFNDGLLDIKETKVIAEIQAQMAAIEKALATGEFDAKLSILGMEYGGAGGNLTADSFQNLQVELETQVAEATESYKEAYAKNYAAIQAAYDAGEYLTDSEYQNAITQLQEEYLRNVSELQMKSIDFQMETIMTQYSGEFNTAYKEYLERVNDTIAKYTENGEYDWLERPAILWNAMIQDISDSTLDKTTRGAISQLLEYMAPTMEEMEELAKQYEELGQEIPLSIMEGLHTYNILNALSNEDVSAMATILGEQMANSKYYEDFYKDIMDELTELDYWVPEEVVSGIASATSIATARSIDSAAEATVKPAVAGMYAWTQEYINEYFAKRISVVASVDMQLNPTVRYFNRLSGLPIVDGINQRANGGLATKPELTWFAENGPEMAIPIDGSRNAISLWEQTGRLLGMNSAFDGLNLSGGSGHTIEYSPTLQFYGDAPSKDDLEDALRISQDEFDSLMDRYFKTHRRVSFG